MIKTNAFFDFIDLLIFSNISDLYKSLSALLNTKYLTLFSFLICDHGMFFVSTDGSTDICRIDHDETNLDTNRNSVRDTHVGGTRCATSSTDQIMNIHVRITLKVECYTNMYFCIFSVCVNTRTSMIKTNAFFDSIDFQVRF